MEDSLRSLCNIDLEELREKVRTEIIKYINDFRKGNTDFSLLFKKEEEVFWNSLLSLIKYKEYENVEEFIKLIKLNNQLDILEKDLEYIKYLKNGY